MSSKAIPFINPHKTFLEPASCQRRRSERLSKGQRSDWIIKKQILLYVLNKNLYRYDNYKPARRRRKKERKKRMSLLYTWRGSKGEKEMSLKAKKKK